MAAPPSAGHGGHVYKGQEAAAPGVAGSSQTGRSRMNYAGTVAVTCRQHGRRQKDRRAPRALRRKRPLPNRGGSRQHLAGASGFSSRPASRRLAWPASSAGAQALSGNPAADNRGVRRAPPWPRRQASPACGSAGFCIGAVRIVAAAGRENSRIAGRAFQDGSQISQSPAGAMRTRPMERLSRFRTSMRRPSTSRLSPAAGKWPSRVRI